MLIDQNNFRDMSILIAEDNDINFIVMRGGLKSNNVEMIRAKNGIEAIEVFNQRKPDIILMDYNMPGMTGLEAAKRIKKDSPEIPIILISAVVDSINNDTSIFDKVIEKPVNFDSLKSDILELLKR